MIVSVKKRNTMKRILTSLSLVVFIMFSTSCSSIRVATDYDKNANFDTYKTFAFFKTGIDKAEINDLDKRRILRAIESELLAKGLTKSESPDLLISLFTKSTQRVNVYNNYWGYGAWGWGGFNYGPGWGWGWNQQPSVSTTTEGTLFIDLIDADKSFAVDLIFIQLNEVCLRSDIVGAV